MKKQYIDGTLTKSNIKSKSQLLFFTPTRIVEHLNKVDLYVTYDQIIYLTSHLDSIEIVESLFFGVLRKRVEHQTIFLCLRPEGFLEILQDVYTTYLL